VKKLKKTSNFVNFASTKSDSCGYSFLQNPIHSQTLSLYFRGMLLAELAISFFRVEVISTHSGSPDTLSKFIMTRWTEIDALRGLMLAMMTITHLPTRFSGMLGHFGICPRGGRICSRIGTFFPAPRPVRSIAPPHIVVAKKIGDNK
jgi:hypothetical protein